MKRYPYLTDMVDGNATVNWATDRSDTSGGVRYGKVGAESCTAHFVAATKTPISVNGVLQYQWKAQLDLLPGTQYCYRVYLGTSPVNEIDLLGSDPAPSFWTQVPMGANQSFSFIVLGDWGYVDSSGTNPYQAKLMSLIASSGARFAVTTGDNGYPDGNQKNYGDLVQTGMDISAVFGPAFWKVPGASLPIFPTLGNHGFSSLDANHPSLITWPQDRAVATSHGRYSKETYCCLNGTTSAAYPSAWYAFDAGPARFYVLEAAWSEANIGTSSEYHMDYAYHWSPGTDQYEWLKNDLATHPSVLKFAFFHYPLYSDNPLEAASPFLLGSDSLEGLLKKNNVDIAFTGHAHIYERNLPSAEGVYNYITGGGGAPLGTLGTCTALDAYAIKFTTTGRACGAAPVPTSAAQVYHFLKVTVNGSSVTVTPINSLGHTFDVQNYSFTSGLEATPPTAPTGLTASVASGTQVKLSWTASTDNSAVRGYGIYRDGILIATVTKNTLTYTDDRLQPATTYLYRVDAFDGSGNHSVLSASTSATTENTASYTFDAVADAYVASDFAATNFGTSALLKADSSPTLRSYLRFHVDDVTGTVTKATLRLYATSSSTTGYQVKRVNDRTWEEGKITYTNAPAVGTVIDSSGSFAAGAWTNIDVTSLVTGNGVYDFALTTSSAVMLNFNSREAGENQPQLIVKTGTDVSLQQTVEVAIGGVQQASYTTATNQTVRASYPGVNNGPIQIRSSDRPVVASQRVAYTPDGGNNWTSYSELMGLPASQVGTSYTFPWYNNDDLNTQLRFANIGNSSTTVKVTIGGVVQGSYALAPKASQRVSYPGLNAGPVKVTSSGGVPIIASERVAYFNGSAWTSFSELMGLPSSKLTSSYMFPWYNNADLNTQLRFGNVGTANTTVTVTIGGQVRGTYSLKPNESTRVSYAGLDAGPVKITSSGGVRIIASMRVAYFNGSAWTDFSEMMGMPTASLSTSYSFPQYNNVDLNTQLRFGNVGNSTTTVTVTVGGVVRGTYTLAPNASQRISYAGLNGGPVVVQSSGGVPIIASERVAYFNGSAWTSFAEMMGLPREQLDTTYWLPWYNNLDLNTQLRFGMP